MIKKPSFVFLAKKHFCFLLDYGFSLENTPEGFNIDNIIGFSDSCIEFIIGLDPRENVVDIYVRKKNELSSSKRFSLYHYLVDRQSFRGGFPQVKFEDPVENQIAKYALLLKDKIVEILKDPKLD